MARWVFALVGTLAFAKVPGNNPELDLSSLTLFDYPCVERTFGHFNHIEKANFCAYSVQHVTSGWYLTNRGYMHMQSQQCKQLHATS
jgi:hypothetical protein